MSNISKLATYTNLTTKCNPRTERVLFLIPHSIVGQWSAKQAADYFCNTDRSCSVNYGIGKDGDISCNVDEDHRAWTTSSSWVDQRGITMEIASDTTAPYAMTDAAINAWLDLAEDICKRYGRTKVLWFGNKEDTNNHQYADNEIAIQVHRWWDNKSCPGDYLYNKIPSLVAELNKRLNKNNLTKNDNVVEEDDDMFYRVQCGAYKEKKNAEAQVAKLKSLGIDCFIVEVDGDIEEAAKPVAHKKSNEEIAREVIQGKWGNGQARKDAIAEAGYDYAAVQSIVNKLCSK